MTSPRNGTPLIMKIRLKNEYKFFEQSSLEQDFTACVDPDDPTSRTYIFLIGGQKGTAYEGGEYIGKLIYPNNYPCSRPKFQIFTPNGRFKTYQNIGSNNLDHYEIKNWSSMNTILNIVDDIRTLWLDDANFNIGSTCPCNNRYGFIHLNESWDERENMARDSIQYNIRSHKEIYRILVDLKCEWAKEHQLTVYG